MIETVTVVGAGEDSIPTYGEWWLLLEAVMAHPDTVRDVLFEAADLLVQYADEQGSTSRDHAVCARFKRAVRAWHPFDLEPYVGPDPAVEVRAACRELLLRIKALPAGLNGPDDTLNLVGAVLTAVAVQTSVHVAAQLVAGTGGALRSVRARELFAEFVAEGLRGRYPVVAAEFCSRTPTPAARALMHAAAQRASIYRLTSRDVATFSAACRSLTPTQVDVAAALLLDGTPGDMAAQAAYVLA